MNVLTPAEEQLMLLFWSLGDFYMKDVMDALPEPKPHQNTVSTYLKILTGKGYLSTEKEGRIFHYHIAVSAEDYKKMALRDFISRHCGNSGKDVLKFLFDEKLVSQNDLADYIDIKIRMKPMQHEPVYEIADEILNSAKDKKKKKKKK